MTVAFPERLKSRKLWLSLIAASIVFANKFWGLNLTENELMTVVGSLLSYVGIQGLADTAKAFRSEPQG